MPNYINRLVALFLAPALIAPTPVPVTVLHSSPQVQFLNQALPAGAVMQPHRPFSELTPGVLDELGAVALPEKPAPEDEFSEVKRSLPADVVAGYERVTAKVATILNARLPGGGSVVIDGMAGGGKTTFALFLQHALASIHHRDSARLAGDAAISRERQDYFTEVIEQDVEVRSVLDHLARFCRVSLLFQLLDDVTGFVGSEGPKEDQRIFVIEDGFLQEGQYGLVQWSVSRGGIALIDFAFGLLVPALLMNKRPIVRARILTEVLDAEQRFGQKAGAPDNSQEADRRKTYHQRTVQIVQPLYEQKTASHIEIFIFLRGNPADWDVRPAAVPVSSAEISPKMLGDLGETVLPERAWDRAAAIRRVEWIDGSGPLPEIAGQKSLAFHSAAEVVDLLPHFPDVIYRVKNEHGYVNVSVIGIATDRYTPTNFSPLFSLIMKFHEGLPEAIFLNVGGGARHLPVYLSVTQMKERYSGEEWLVQTFAPWCHARGFDAAMYKIRSEKKTPPPEFEEVRIDAYDYLIYRRSNVVDGLGKLPATPPFATSFTESSPMDRRLAAGN